MSRLISILCVLVLCSCAGYDKVRQSWVGRNAGDLVFAWGPPTGERSLSDGRRILAYSYSGTYVSLTPDGDGYVFPLDCTVLFRVSAGGVIQSADLNGHIGGCNRLMVGKPTAS